MPGKSGQIATLSMRQQGLCRMPGARQFKFSRHLSSVNAIILQRFLQDWTRIVRIAVTVKLLVKKDVTMGTNLAEMAAVLGALLRTGQYAWDRGLTARVQVGAARAVRVGTSESAAILAESQTDN